MAGRRIEITWAHSAEELATRLADEPEPRRRQRLQALCMLRRGQRLSDVSATVGADYRTVQRWVAWYRIEGLEGVLRRRLPGHGAPGRRSKLAPEQSLELKDRFERGQFRTIREAVDWTRDHFGAEFSYQGMVAHLNRSRRGRGGPA